MGEEKPVRACMCFPHTFAEIKQIAHERGWTTVDEISRGIGCGTGCGLCRPYLAKMLETGSIAFAILPAEAPRS